MDYEGLCWDLYVMCLRANQRELDTFFCDEGFCRRCFQFEADCWEFRKELRKRGYC